MPKTHTESAQTNPRIEVLWEDVNIWGFDPAPSGTPTVTVLPETGTFARASLPSAGETTKSIGPTDQGGCTNVAWEAPVVGDALDETRAKLAQIRTEEGVGGRTVELAEHVLVELAKATLLPARVVLSADREIAFVFFGDELVAGGAHRRVATLTCSEDGITAIAQNRDREPARAWDVELEQLTDSLGRIRDFVAGQ